MCCFFCFSKWNLIFVLLSFFIFTLSFSLSLIDPCMLFPSLFMDCGFCSFYFDLTKLMFLILIFSSKSKIKSCLLSLFLPIYTNLTFFRCRIINLKTVAFSTLLFSGNLSFCMNFSLKSFVVWSGTSKAIVLIALFCLFDGTVIFRFRVYEKCYQWIVFMSLFFLMDMLQGELILDH